MKQQKSGNVKFWPTKEDVQVMPWFSICVLVLFLCTIILIRRWSDIKGAHFMSISQYSTTKGIIVHSTVYEGQSKRGNPKCYNIHYQYQVQGINYSGKQVDFLDTQCSSEHAAYSDSAYRYIEKYPVGRNVVVYYDARVPSFSVLEPTVKSNWTGLMICTLIFGALCPSVWKLTRKNASSSSRRKSK